MSAVRRAASRLLQFVVQRSPDEERSWGAAVLREMDFVDGDWAALRWALGGVTTICRHSLLQRLGNWRWLSSVLSGVAAAVVILSVSVLALVAVMRASPLAPNETKLAERLFIVVIPMALYLLGIVALWRARRRMAFGILAAGVILVAHAIAHFVTYG
jgi:hypothetical protein